MKILKNTAKYKKKKKLHLHLRDNFITIFCYISILSFYWVYFYIFLTISYMQICILPIFANNLYKPETSSYIPFDCSFVT